MGVMPAGSAIEGVGRPHSVASGLAEGPPARARGARGGRTARVPRAGTVDVTGNQEKAGNAGRAPPHRGDQAGKKARRATPPQGAPHTPRGPG